MKILEYVRKYKHYLSLVSFIGALGTGLFVKIDAYAQGKVDAGVEKLREEVHVELGKFSLKQSRIELRQEQQQKQLDRIEDKQDDMIHLLLEMKRTKDAGQ